MDLLKEKIKNDGIVINENVLKVDNFLNQDVPLVIFKKQSSAILDTETTIQTPVHSFTKNTDYVLMASKKYLSENDNILIIDDFLANGQAALGAYRILKEAGSSVAGIGIVIEKSFQDGRKKLEDLGLDVYSLARVSKISSDGIEFLN